MKKRLIGLLLSLTLIFTLVPEALAYDASAMTDIAGHWAEDNIVWVMEAGLFQGVSETAFNPEGTMTRGMFVTVLGRLAGIDPEAYQDWYLENLYTDVAPDLYYAPYINWATRYGIANGYGDGRFQPDTPVTREQAATLMVRFASIYNFDLTSISEDIVDSFTDADSISDFAASAVESMRITGIINGRPGPEGTYYFDPQDDSTRAECATMFRRLSDSMQENTTRQLVDPTGIELSAESATLINGESTTLYATVVPDEATNQTITWVSSDPQVATVNNSGKVTAISEGTADVYCYTWNGYYQYCTVTCERPSTLAYAGETYEEKCIRIFGEVVDDPRTYYTSQEEAESHMVSISVQVWDFTDSTKTTKTTKTMRLQVHENIADTVIAIFNEIYQCPAQYPFCSMGGYRWSTSKSEHTPGLAVDVNPDQNYYCDPDGNALTGSYFDPENDPYSIPVDGEVQQIFEKYGFTRGIYWNSGYKDYMHFSYFGT